MSKLNAVLSLGLLAFLLILHSNETQIATASPGAAPPNCPAFDLPPDDYARVVPDDISTAQSRPADGYTVEFVADLTELPLDNQPPKFTIKWGDWTDSQNKVYVRTDVPGQPVPQFDMLFLEDVDADVNLYPYGSVFLQGVMGTVARAFDFGQSRGAFATSDPTPPPLVSGWVNWVNAMPAGPQTTYSKRALQTWLDGRIVHPNQLAVMIRWKGKPLEAGEYPDNSGLVVINIGNQPRPADFPGKYYPIIPPPSLVSPDQVAVWLAPFQTRLEAQADGQPNSDVVSMSHRFAVRFVVDKLASAENMTNEQGLKKTDDDFLVITHEGCSRKLPVRFYQSSAAQSGRLSMAEQLDGLLAVCKFIAALCFSAGCAVVLRMVLPYFRPLKKS